MAVTVTLENAGNYLAIDATDKLYRDDYKRFVPEVERAMHGRGKTRLLFNMHNFHGWSVGAAWEDTKFAFRHFRDIERIAIVGEKPWQHAMTLVCRPFTRARIRYFSSDRQESARQWLAQN